MSDISVWDVVLFLSGIAISYAIGVVQGRRSPRTPELRVRKHEMGGLGGVGIPGVSISFRGIEVPRVRRTRFALWLDGQTVSSDDIVSGDPLRIAAEDGEILDVDILATSKGAIGGGFEFKDNTVNILFDYLDSGDGLILEIIHSGEKEPEVRGYVRGLSLRMLPNTDLSYRALQRRGGRQKRPFLRTWLLTPLSRAWPVPVFVSAVIAIPLAIGGATRLAADGFPAAFEAMTLLPAIAIGFFVLMFTIQILNVAFEDARANIPKTVVNGLAPDRGSS